MIQLEKFKAGRKEKVSGYSYFVPEPINSEWNWSTTELNQLLERAAGKLGELKIFAKIVPDVDLFLQLHITKEAVVSSRIEGTQTNIAEALMPEKEIYQDRKNDWIEVHNYIRAMNTAIGQLSTLPISSRLMKNTHRILLSGVRGEHKNPGEFRNSQNWIGGKSLSDAVFIPPHQHYVETLMGDLENFIHNEDISVPLLIRIGIIHYQFETIHPFLDGNGRIGRLLITLYMVEKGILEKPLLYLSEFFESDKNLYYDNLTRVRENNDMLHWLKYFLVGVEQTALKATETLSGVLQLKSDTEKLLQNELGKRAASGLKLLHELFKNPVVNAQEIMQICSLSKKAANDLISALIHINVLKEITGQSRGRIYSFESYLNLFKQ